MPERRHIHRTRISTWTRKGFMAREAYYLSELSPAGAQAPYIKAMVRHRIAMKAAAKRYKWTPAHYRAKVIADYKKLGIRGLGRDKKGQWETYEHYFDKVFYDYFTAWKDKTPPDNEYQSPRKKRRVRVAGEARAQATRRKMLNAKIDELNQNITRASMKGNISEMRRLESERNRYQKMLDRLDK